MIVEQKPLAMKIGATRIELWPEERAMLRDFANLRKYPTAYTQTMQYLQREGMFSRLEECGPNGTAEPTLLGAMLLERVSV